MTDPTKPGDRPAVDDLERLRALILGEDKGRMDSLYERVTEPESRTSDVAEVLPGAMNRVIRDPLAAPQMERPIVDTIKSAIKHDTESFAEALFPVLGPAIRRAVADALRSLVQRINSAMEHSFTVKGLRWRMEAAKSGVPFGQVVLRHTMVYAVQEVFLIRADSGLIIASARREDTLLLDKDAFSAMITAIQAFVSDSFGASNGEPLRSAELGDRTLWLINGPEALLACVIIGTPPHEVREQLMSSLEILHSQFGDRFDESPDTLAKEPGISAILQDTLTGEVASPATASKNSRSRYVWGAAGLALLLLPGWYAWSVFHDHRLDRELAGLFESEPGYVLTAHDVRDGRFFLAGLRDPLARPPDSVIEAVDIDQEAVSLVFHPYQSLEDELIRRRIYTVLGSDPGLKLELSDSNLAVNGILTSAQMDMLKNLPGIHPIIHSVDLSQTRLPPAEAIEQARQRLAPPSSVTFTPAQSGDRIEASGISDADWFEAAQGSGKIGGWTLDFSPMQEALNRHFSEWQQRLDGSTIQFSGGLRINEESQAQLESLGRELVQYQALADVLGYTTSIQLEGFADGVGSADKNREFAMSRARAVQSELVNSGIDPADLTLKLGHWKENVEDPLQRKVVVHVTGEPTR
jgi:OOP family OmpA-OmpF porin